MSIEQKKLKNIIEAALMAVAKPMTADQLMELFVEEERPSNNTLKQALSELMEESADRGVELKEVASGFRYQAKQEYSEWLSRMWEERPAKYSRAALETLALIAYRQPVTRAEIEDVRGVGVSSSIVKTMIEREWIRVVGHRDVPGRPALYATTKQFLDYFNMKSLDELPSLAEIKDLEDLNPELDLPNPDDEREQKSDLNSAEGDDESELTESNSESSEVDKQTDEQTLTQDAEQEESDLHLQTDVFTELEESIETDELDDIHTETVNDSFYAEDHSKLEVFDSTDEQTDPKDN